MKLDADPSPFREFPHLISRGDRRNHRWNIAVGNTMAEATGAIGPHTFAGPGFVAASGDLTSRGRDAVLRGMRAKARTSAARYCIVWSADSCTWIDGDGRTRDGVSPPRGEPVNPLSCGSPDIDIEWSRTIELPEGGEWSHLCIRRINPDLVDVAPGERCVLADFSDPVPKEHPDPAAPFLDKAGRLVPPKTFRGQRVTGVDDRLLLGPVQPAERGEILRNPWPEDVRAACERIAGMALPPSLTDAAWRAIDPTDPDVIYVGVQQAA